jgi:hypothetical protein
MEIKLLFLAFLVMLCVSSTRLIYHDGVMRNLRRLGRHCKMLAVLIVSTVIYAGSLGVEIRQECFQMIEKQEERIRQIVAAKNVREKVDFVMTTSRGTRFEFGDGYGMRRVSGADAGRGGRIRETGRRDSAVAESADCASWNYDDVVHAVYELFGKSRQSSGFPRDSKKHPYSL